MKCECCRPLTHRDYDALPSIRDLRPGEKGYTTPWAFSDEYRVRRAPFGTASMEVGRNADGSLWIGSPSATELVIADRAKSAPPMPPPVDLDAFRDALAELVDAANRWGRCDERDTRVGDAATRADLARAQGREDEAWDAVCALVTSDPT